MNVERKPINKIKNQKFFHKIEKPQLYTHLTKSKNKTKDLINHNHKIFNNINSNLESKTNKKTKINHLNIKSIIKKIDLFSLSLTKKSAKKDKLNSSKENKKIIEKGKTTDNTLMPINLEKFKIHKKPQKLFYIRKNLKNFNDDIRFGYNSNRNVYHDDINLTDQRYRYKRNGGKIKFLQLYIKRGYRNFNSNSNIISNYYSNDIYNSKNALKTENNKLYKMIKNDSNKNKFLYKSEYGINKKNLSIKMKKQEKKNKLRRNNTEIRRLNIHLENIIDAKYSYDKINIKASKQKNIQKKQTYEKNKGKKLLINISNSKIKKIKNNIINKKLNINLINNINYPNTNQKMKKENYKNRIPKPIITISNINLNEIYHNYNYNYNTTNSKIFKIKNKKDKEKGEDNYKRPFSIDILNKKLENTSSKTEKEFAKINITNNNTNNYIKTNFINNSLINIRGYTFPGKTSNGQLKLNQDSFIIHRDINYIKNFNIFGVFDGHGFDGHIISNYIKENIIDKFAENPRINLLKNLDEIYELIIKDNYKLIRDIFNEIDNDILNNGKEFDVNLSGSTCTIIIQIGDNIICANVGDSKAILVYEDSTNEIIDNDSKYKFIKLSKNSTPELNNEKMRIEMNGGKIIRLKNDLNQQFGPLRIFKKDKDIPGLTITRSFGDKLGKSIGVISSPFINEYTLNKSVKYIVIASDGVWQFMNEKDLIIYGTNFYKINDPDNFCKKIYYQSSELWQQNSCNIDDITLIVIFFTFL